jgi:cytochrome c oxidase assembly protein subunit 11
MGQTRSGPRNLRTAVLLAGVFAGMVGLSFAAVPLYRLFCQVTGYGGTTQVATAAPEAVAGETIRVRFNADIVPALAWQFRPEQVEMELELGARAMAYYRATSRAEAPTIGTATFNVTPQKAGIYFSKIDCFCFQEQRLEAGQSARMPVDFFVDPALLDDPDMQDVKTITLSYTFFPHPDAQAAAADGDADGAGEADG